MKILKFHARTTKIVKIKEFQRNYEIDRNPGIPLELLKS